MGRLTTHVLDTAHGLAAVGVAVRLRTEDGTLLAEAVTNRDGRCDRPLLEGEALRVGRYALEFGAADYFRSRGVALVDPPFLDRIVIAFAVADARGDYHVPLLVSPYGYTTYRGS